MNKRYSVNMGKGFALELALKDKLEQLIRGIDWFQGWCVESEPLGMDGAWDVVVTGPDGNPVFAVECKSQLSPSQFSQTLLNRYLNRSGVVPILGMPRVSPRMAQLCQDNGWGWYDLAGNCHLELPGTLLLERTGRDPVKIDDATPEANLGTPESGRIVRALLAPENAGKRWTQREFVEHFTTLSSPIPAPSLALVNKVVQYLRNQAMVKNMPPSGFQVSDPEALLQAWTRAYRFDKHVQRRFFTLLKDSEVMARLRTLENEQLNYALSVFSAANLQAPHVRQSKIWLYGEPGQEHRLAKYLDAELVESGHNLVMLLSEDPAVMYKPEQSSTGIRCTNTIQTYVDLLHVGGRGEEAAEALLNQRLRPQWNNS